MLNKANPKLIGTFVLGALLLLVATLLLFGSGAWFKPRHKLVAYFGGSVQGLDVGSPVRFRGVRIGQVKDLELQFVSATHDFRIRTILEINTRSDEGGGARALDEDLIEELIKKGLRAQLVNESLITGRLFVNLDFFTDEPLVLVNEGTGLLEVPTAQTDMEKLQNAARTFYTRVSQLPLEEIVTRLNNVLGNVEKVSGAPETQELPRRLRATFDELDRLVATLHKQMPETIGEIRETLDQGRSTLQGIEDSATSITSSWVTASGEAQRTLKSVREQLTFGSGPLGEMASSFNESAAALRTTLQQVQSTLQKMEQSAGPDSPLNYTLGELLRELTATSRAARQLADYLERHPEAMLKGKP